MPLYAGELNLRSNAPLAEYPAPLGEVLRSQREQTRLESPTTALSRLNDLDAAERGDLLELGDPMGGTRDVYAPPKMVDAATARTRVADEGLTLNIPQDGIAERALDILIKRKREELQRANVMSRGPDGVGAGAARLGVALFESLLDPLNIASAFVPVVGPARYARLVGGAAGAMGRAGVRAGVGAAEGAVGAAMLEPLIYAAAQAEQADYSMADSLTNIGFGAIFGGGLHVAAGTARDWIQPGWWRETPPGRSPNEAQVVAMRVEPETRDAALRVSVAQAAEGRVVDVEPIVRANPDTVSARGLTPDAEDLLRSADEGGVPGFVSNNLRRIARENGVDVSPSSTPNEIIAALRARQSGSSAAGFTTAKGSTYEVMSDGTTVRDKAARPEHPGESGPQPRSERTFYVAAEDAVKLGEFQTQGGASRVVEMLPDGQRAGVRYVDGKDAGKFEGRTVVSIKAQPAVGLTPVELWDGGKRVHFGNAITDVTPAGRAPSAPPVTPDQARAAADRNHSPAAIRSAEEPIPEPVKMSDDVKAAQQELDNAMTVVEEMAEALGVDRTIVRALMVDQDALIARAADYAKALKAGAACGVA